MMSARGKGVGPKSEKIILYPLKALSPAPNPIFACHFPDIYLKTQIFGPPDRFSPGPVKKHGRYA